MWLWYVVPGVLLTAVVLVGCCSLLSRGPAREPRTAPRPFQGLIRLSGLFFGALVLVGMAGAFSLPLFEAPSDTVGLPIEVIGPDGHTVSVQVHASEGRQTEALSLKAHSIGYPYHLANLRGYSVDKASIRINDGDWVDVNNRTVTCTGIEATVRCVDGPMHTIRVQIPASALGAFNDGANMVHFRFNYAAPSPAKGDPSTGYRILDLEFESASGTDLIDGTTFSWDDPGTWRAPSGYDSAGDVSDGEALWEARDALVDGWNGENIWASCADCHTKSGFDLQYFAFSNHSIVQRARFHGLSEAEGKKIAAYIRSIQIETYDGTTIDPPGRPWHPPYQPGPTQVSSRAADAPRTEGTAISDLDPMYWAAGAGVEWALDDDGVTKEYLFPEGLHASALAVDGTMNQREIPVAVQMPDWNEWLPVHHPIDVWGEAFRDHRTYQAYLTQTPDNLWRAENGDYQKLEDATHPLWSGLEQGQDNFKGRGVPAPYDWQVAELSRMQWALTKHFETLVPTHMENKVREFRGPQADRLQWPSTARILFDQAPHIGVKKDGATYKGQDHDTMDGYFDTAWYQLQLVVNSGATYSTGQSPIDWLYHFRHIPQVGAHPWRYATSYLKLLQNAETIAEDGNTPLQEVTSEGWHMRHTNLLFVDGQHIWFRDAEAALSSEENRRLLNLVSKMFVDGMSENDPDHWARIDNSDQGIDPADQTPTRYTGPIGQKSETDRHWWTALENYGEAGVAYEHLRPLAQWAAEAWPKGDWMEHIEPYRDNPPAGTESPTVQLVSPASDTVVAAASDLVLEASADHADRVEFFVDDASVGVDSASPYTTTWTPPSDGPFTLTATATDENGDEDSGEAVTVTVESAEDGGADSTGVTYSYYEGTWDRLPDFESLSPVESGTTDTFTLAPAQRETHFALRFEGFLKVPADTAYTFSVESDDGATLHIGSTLVVDNDGVHESTEASGTIRLSGGYHPITVAYFEADGAERLAVRWESDSIAQTTIPPERLVPERPGPSITHQLSLRKGWNLISTYVSPDDPSFDRVFERLQSDLVVAKDERGRLYSPPHNLSELSRWTQTEAYQVYLRSERSLSFEGPRVPANAPIPLEPGWNFVPYLPSDAQPVEEAFAALGDRLVVVKDQTGAPYLANPDYDVNEIGDVVPGAGYKVYVNQVDTLRYPAATNTTRSSSSRPAPAEEGGRARGTATSATLIVEPSDLDDGAVVRASVEDDIVARARVSDGTAVLTVPGGSRFGTNDEPQATPDDAISLSTPPDGAPLKVRSAVSLVGQSSGASLTYRPGSVYHVKTAQTEDIILEKNAPNPVRSTTTISYILPEETTVSLTIYNVLGQKVATLVDATRPAGSHAVTLDASTLSSGVYFYRLETGSRTRSRKLSIVQ